MTVLNKSGTDGGSGVRDPEPSLHDPGGKIRLRLQPGVHGLAEFSLDKQYRYWLSRFWNFSEPRNGGIEPYALWIGMNPSTAAEDIDDPTIRKEMQFTHGLGINGYIKCNVMDYRATDPRRLLEPGVLPCSAVNHDHIRRLADEASIIVLAYGSLPKRLRWYGDIMSTILAMRTLYCLGRNADGSPKHPLYLKSSTQLEKFHYA